MIRNNRRNSLPTTAGRTNESTARRRLLGASVITGAAIPFIPTAWKQPVVESVLLPAHAESSPGEDDSEESTSSQPQTLSVTKGCNEEEDNEYFTIVFPNDSASAGSSFTIEGPFTTPPSVSGDNVRLRFSTDDNQVFFDETTSGLNTIANPFCGNEDDSIPVSLPLANGTNTLDFTADINIQANQIEYVLRDFAVN